MKSLKEKYSNARGRRRLWQLGKISEGLCSICGDSPLASSELCKECMEKNRTRARLRARLLHGWKPRQAGKPGRPLIKEV